MGSSNQNILQKNPSWFEVASLLLLLLLLSFILNSLSPCSHTLPRTCGHFFILLMFAFELMIYSHGKGIVLAVQFCLIIQCCLKPSNQNPRCNSTVFLHYFFPSSLIPPFLLLLVIIVIISAYIHLCRHCCCFDVCIVVYLILLQALTLLEKIIWKDPTTNLQEGLLFNLCTIYELESSYSLQKKQKLLELVSKHRGDGFNVSCLKIP